MALIFISFSRLGISLVSELIHFHESCHSFESFKECIVHCRIVFHLIESMLPSILSCLLMFKAKFESLPIQVKTTFMSVPFELVLWLHYLQHFRSLFQVSCHWCGIHHVPPSTRLFLSTSAHHPRNSFRNKFSTLISACLNEKYSLSQHRFT